MQKISLILENNATIETIEERDGNMKILCVSDTHFENMKLMEITNCFIDIDMYIHCGDSSLETNDPLLEKYIVVKGNHDDADFPLEHELYIANNKCLITHGHLFDVYHGYDEVLAYMEKNNYDICFHGHTHVPGFYQKNNRTIINPGSVMINRASYGFGTFAIVDINEEQSISITLYNSDTFEKCSELVLADGKEIMKKYKEMYK